MLKQASTSQNKHDSVLPVNAQAVANTLGSQLVEPVWLAPGAPSGEIATEGWAALLETDTRGTVFLHPELVLSHHLVTDDKPWVYARWDAGNRMNVQPSVVAALLPRTVRIATLPGFNRTFRGRRLVGDRVLGDNHTDSLAGFIHAVADSFAARRSECLLVEDVNLGSPLWEALRTAGEKHKNVAVFYPAKPQPRWRIFFPDPPQDYWAKFSKKARYNLRRSVKLLDHSITCYRRPEEVAEFLQKAHQVSKVSWQSKSQGLRVKNSDEEKRFLGAAANQGALRSYVLQQGERPIAFVIGFHWKRRFSYEEVAYDPDFASQSPGNVLLVRVLDDLIENDTPEIFDFGLGDAAYKRLFGNDESISGPVLLVQRSWSTCLALCLAHIRSSISESMRGLGKKLHVWRLLRRWSRR